MIKNSKTSPKPFNMTSSLLLLSFALLLFLLSSSSNPNYKLISISSTHSTRPSQLTLSCSVTLPPCLPFSAWAAPASPLTLLPSLKLVVASSAGIDHIDLQECRRRGITVTSAGQVFSEDVADFSVELLIDVLGRVSASDGYVRSGLWVAKGPYPLGVKLGGKRVGIVGLGRIGSEVAKRLIAFGCNIAYCSRKEKPFVPYLYYSTVSDLATKSDALILCCSLTKETHHIINRSVMEALGKEGVIINIGRGGSDR